MRFLNLCGFVTTLLLCNIHLSFGQCQASYSWTASGTVVTFNSVTGGMNPASTSYYWTFGDGSTATGSNPTHTYNMNGLFSVCLVASDSNCTFTYCDSVSVSNNNPCSGFGVSAFAFNDTTSTVNGLVYFNASASGGTAPFTYLWDFGDNSSASGQFTNHNYNNPNQWYLYCVTATDANGCTATYCDSVDANNPCTDSSIYANFSYQDNNGVVQFFSSTSQNVGNYFWSFGDGTSSTLANPFHQYTTGGTYNVYLYVNFNNGCSRSYMQTITVGNSNPCNNFSASYTYTTNSNVVSFASSVIGGTPPYSYSWNFGDGGSSTQANPNHTYANTNANYGAILVVSDANGCMFTSYDTVVINSGANPCTLNELTLAINFDNYAYETSWDLRDGQGLIVASGANYTPNQNGTNLTQTFCLPTDCYVFNIYDSYGDGICCLYGQGDYSLSDATGNVLASGGSFGYTDTKTICLGGATNPCSNFTTFFSSSSNGSVVNFSTNGIGMQYVWDFGDNTVGSGSNPVHTYNSVPASGMYTVCVTAYDTLGCVATYCDTVSVNALPCNNNQLTLALNFDNFAYETSWTLTDANNVVLYSGNGYTNADNGTTQYFNFCLPTGCYDFNIYDSFGDGICCGWGQGSYVLADASNSVLASGGNFTQSETTNVCIGGVSNPCGNFNTAFTYSTTANGFVNLTATNTGGAGGYSYTWDFGNGTTSAQMNPTVSYANNGNYTVCLTVVDSNNCTATYCQNVIITTLNNNPAPCNGLSVDMNISQDTINPFILWMQPVINNAANNAFFYYVWDFGDNTGAFSGSPTHQYANFGSYVICLTAFDSVNNCIATFCDTITIDSAGNFSRNINYKDTKPGFRVNTMAPIINYYSSTTAYIHHQFELNVFPNPATDQLQLSLTTAEAGTGIVSILNIAGQVVFEESLTCPLGQCNHTYKLNQLVSGVYLIKWASKTGQQTRKFIKQ